MSRFGFVRREKIFLLLIFLIAAVALYFGWRLFWFLTDDAFIAFRYVSNSRLGFGYVWNAPPFRPVEGYTSFLWVALLDVVWRILGIEPPGASNWLSLAFSFLSLVLLGLMCLGMNWNERLKSRRFLFLILILTGTLANTTFLAWTSSGLETALFNFSVLFWVFSCLYVDRGRGAWFLLVSVSSLLIYLTRPDGLLYVAVSLIILFYEILDGEKWNRLPLLFPMLGVPAHLLWRRSFYGEWLPNTYYAKVLPGFFGWETGYRYFLSFMIEYNLWFWLLLCLMWFGYQADRLLKSRRSRRPAARFTKEAVIGSLVGLALAGHFLYYTVVVGGDHFEYRVYSYLIPLLFLSFVWFLNKMPAAPSIAIAAMAVFVILSWPLSWARWWITRDVPFYRQIVYHSASLADLTADISPRLPALLNDYLRYYDNTQLWLADHYICLRQYQHKRFAEHLIDYYPSREDGSMVGGDGFPVAKMVSVGVASWVFPHVNIIDEKGLNDWVIARNPNLFGRNRMAHERQPPPGYVECFDANVNTRRKRIAIVQRDIPLTAGDIRTCEAHFAQWVTDQQLRR